MFVEEPSRIACRQLSQAVGFGRLVVRIAAWQLTCRPGINYQTKHAY
jgi:hypothetical protein